jgi:hypothetical protein
MVTSCKRPTDAQVKNAIQVIDMDTKWVAKEFKQWPHPKLTLVPTISFKVKNLSPEPLKYVNFNAVFKERDAVDNLGDNFFSAIGHEPVLPGAISSLITMKSNFGVEGKTLDSFKNNPQWKTYYVKLFAQVRGSRHVLLGQWPVSRKIDFKEPEPPRFEGDKKEEPSKK